MLGSQRGLFSVPRDICYLNSASYSPLPLRTQEAFERVLDQVALFFVLAFAAPAYPGRARPC